MSGADNDKSNNHTHIAPVDREEELFLAAIQDPENRKKVIAILKRGESAPA